MTNRPAPIALFALLAGCAPPEEAAPELHAPLVVAVRAWPAELTPGASASLEALWIAPLDAPADPKIRWALCLLPPPLIPDLPVDPRCADEAGAHLLPLGEGRYASLTVPLDACARFGPSPGPAAPGAPAPRPIDPDASGGFSLPVRVQPDGGPVTLARLRLACPPANLPSDAARRLAQEAVPNEHPRLVRFGAVAAGRSLRLRIEAADDAAERWLWWDPAGRRLVERTEALELTLHTTSGTLSQHRLTLEAGETAEVQLDGAAEDYAAWAVLRDERGGVDVRSIRTR